MQTEAEADERCPDGDSVRAGLLVPSESGAWLSSAVRDVERVSGMSANQKRIDEEKGNWRA